MISKEEIFSVIEKERGGVAEIYSAFASIPTTIKAHFELNKALMLDEGLPLPRVEREWLAMETSRANRCDYAFQHHKVAYEAHLKTEPEPPLDRLSLLSILATSITNIPTMSGNFREKVLAAGFTESQWLHALKIVAYFNFTNRLALGLNLQLEPDFSSTCR